ncbi:MAG: hypothetical protein JXB85_05575 [Anaerolineales bacterium]|nr:hypothetical protein [Anaerolineales bacterium]
MLDQFLQTSRDLLQASKHLDACQAKRGASFQGQEIAYPYQQVLDNVFPFLFSGLFRLQGGGWRGNGWHRRGQQPGNDGNHGLFGLFLSDQVSDLVPDPLTQLDFHLFIRCSNRFGCIVQIVKLAKAMPGIWKYRGNCQQQGPLLVAYHGLDWYPQCRNRL